MARGESALEFGDMQALLRFGHGHLGAATFLLLRVADPDAAREWLAAAPVSAAQRVQPPPARALQVALTAPGLRALGVGEGVLAGFSAEFNSGMTGNPNRSRRLGDTGENSPESWQWGGPAAGEPHLLLMLYARSGELDGWREEVAGPLFARAFITQVELAAATLSPREPFGFVDGISQPEIDWWDEARPAGRGRTGYSNFLALGELVLGYRNEYGLYTDRPLLAESEGLAAGLPAARDVEGMRDFGRNGSYLVLRQLEQDVPAFWRYLHAAAGGDADAREALAAALVGRRRDGAPLVPATGDNGFDYRGDPLGLRCPLGAHIRRANPRTGDFPAGVRGPLSRLLSTFGFGGGQPTDDLVASSRFHRLLRRGRAYGPGLSVEEVLAGAEPRAECGLYFLCLGANIARQFEFVQNAWIASSKFAGLAAEADPLLGSREPLAGGTPTDRFTRPRGGAPAECLGGLPRFVRVRGGAYFFLPGIRALRGIAGGG